MPGIFSKANKRPTKLTNRASAFQTKKRRFGWKPYHRLKIQLAEGLDPRKYKARADNAPLQVKGALRYHNQSAIGH